MTDEPALRLFLFHHAGGSAAGYAGWAERLPAAWDVVACDAPGRGSRSRQRPVEDAGALAAWYERELGPLLRPGGVPFAFFGHSMGAIVAYELALRLAARPGGPRPCWVGVSACVAPRPGRVPEPRSGYPADRLKEWLVTAGGTDRAVAAHPLVWRMVEPLLRADLRVVESWRPQAGTPPLTVPLAVFGGVDDPLVARAELTDWQRCSTRFAGQHLFDGGHFYLQQHAAEVVARVARGIGDALTTAAGKTTAAGAATCADTGAEAVA